MNPLVFAGLIVLASPGSAGSDPTPAPTPALEVAPATTPEELAPVEENEAEEAPQVETEEEARRKAENEAVIRLSEGTPSRPLGTRDESMSGIGGALTQMLVVLGGVCLLAYLLLGKVLPRLMRVQIPEAPRRILKVIDRVALDQRGSLLIVAIGDSYFLVGASQGGIDLISRLETDVVLAALENPAAQTPSFSKWAETLLTKRPKEN